MVQQPKRKERVRFAVLGTAGVGGGGRGGGLGVHSSAEKEQGGGVGGLLSVGAAGQGRK